MCFVEASCKALPTLFFGRLTDILVVTLLERISPSIFLYFLALGSLCSTGQPRSSKCSPEPFLRPVSCSRRLTSSGVRFEVSFCPPSFSSFFPISSRHFIKAPVSANCSTSLADLLTKFCLAAIFAVSDKGKPSTILKYLSEASLTIPIPPSFRFSGVSIPPLIDALISVDFIIALSCWICWPLAMAFL